jgi:hypothetical protein
MVLERTSSLDGWLSILKPCGLMRVLFLFAEKLIATS